MAQQYLPPALMLEQLRNERYRQAAQGLQQGITGALQTYMNMEQLKQAAAEKKAERDERARQFNAKQQLREAELQSLRDLRTGRLGVQRQEQALAEKKAGEARADALRKQTLDDVQRMALGVAKGQKPITGVDARTAEEFMRQGISRFGQKAQTIDEATGRAAALFQNLEQLAAEQEQRPEALALAEAARVKGIDLPYGELRGVMTQSLTDRDKAALGLDELRAKISATKALGAKRRRAARGGGRGIAGRGKKEKIPYAEIEKAYEADLKYAQSLAKNAGQLLEQAEALEKPFESPYGELIERSPEDKQKAANLRKQYADLADELQNAREQARNRYEQAMRRARAGELDIYGAQKPAVEPAQPVDAVTPEQSMMRPEQLADIQGQAAVDPAQVRKQQEIARIDAEMVRLAPQANQGPGSEAAIRINELAKERDKLKGVVRPDAEAGASYRREAQQAIAQGVALSPQDLDRLIADAPLATRREMKAEAAKMQNAGLSRDEIAAVLGGRRAEMLPLSRGRF